ncbi:MAG: hypothetical protein AB2693_14985 [Candidatus Thiodiazotropha sp.]
MRFRRQPLSEEFFYSSPEKPTGNSFRWVPSGSVIPPRQSRNRGEVRCAEKKRY